MTKTFTGASLKVYPVVDIEKKKKGVVIRALSVPGKCKEKGAGSHKIQKGSEEQRETLSRSHSRKKYFRT